MSKTIFDALREDHETQRNLADLLVETHGDSAERDTLFASLRQELQAHAAAEERCFYIPLLEHDQTQEKSRHSIAEHHEIDGLIDDLEQTDPSSPGWLATAKRLREQVYHHLHEEEHEVFQMAGKVLSDAQKTALARDYAGEMSSQRDKAA